MRKCRRCELRYGDIMIYTCYGCRHYRRVALFKKILRRIIGVVLGMLLMSAVLLLCLTPVGATIALCVVMENLWWLVSSLITIPIMIIFADTFAGDLFDMSMSLVKKGI